MSYYNGTKATIETWFTIAALICFILAAAGVPAGRLNLTALGLALYISTLLMIFK